MKIHIRWWKRPKCKIQIRCYKRPKYDNVVHGYVRFDLLHSTTSIIGEKYQNHENSHQKRPKCKNPHQMMKKRPKYDNIILGYVRFDALRSTTWSLVKKTKIMKIHIRFLFFSFFLKFVFNPAKIWVPTHVWVQRYRSQKLG